MSGKRYAHNSISEEEYRRLHEAEMRARFMQTEIPSLIERASQPTQVVLVEERLPALTDHQWEIGLVRTRLAPRTVSVTAMSSLAMPAAAVQAMRPLDVYLADVQADLAQLHAKAEYPQGINLLSAAEAALEQERRQSEEVDLLIEDVAPRMLPAPAAPPAWYQQAARDLVALLEGAGFAIQAYSSKSHTVTLARGDGSKIQISLQALQAKNACPYSQPVPFQPVPVEIAA
ncbi:MAG: hypothetical protein JW726_20140 [Anaerolineales bacterium]|nr:hypothetical protein [Anaerolineales bacterium]